MGIVYAKRIRIMPGLSLNVSRRGVGYSIGPRGLHLTRRVGGGWTRNIDLPGGFRSRGSVGESVPAKRKRKAQEAEAAVESSQEDAAKRPGMFAPRWEKALFRVLDSPDEMGLVAMEHPDEPHAVLLAAALEGLFRYENGEDGRAAELLGFAVENDHDGIAGLEFSRNYLSDRTWQVGIVAGITVDLSLADDAVLLAAAEVFQAAGNLPDAIICAEGCDPTSASALSLTDLYSDAGQDQDVIDLTDGVDNEDDATALMLVLRGRAFGRLGFFDAARESFRQALAPRSRIDEVRHRARVERAFVNQADGKIAAARKDLQTVLADDPSFPGLREALDALPDGARPG